MPINIYIQSNQFSYIGYTTRSIDDIESGYSRVY